MKKDKKNRNATASGNSPDTVAVRLKQPMNKHLCK